MADTPSPPRSYHHRSVHLDHNALQCGHDDSRVRHLTPTGHAMREANNATLNHCKLLLHSRRVSLLVGYFRARPKDSRPSRFLRSGGLPTLLSRLHESRCRGSLPCSGKVSRKARIRYMSRDHKGKLGCFNHTQIPSTSACPELRSSVSHLAEVTQNSFSGRYHEDGEGANLEQTVFGEILARS